MAQKGCACTRAAHCHGAAGSGQHQLKALILHFAALWLWHSRLVRQVGNRWLKAGCMLQLSHLPCWELLFRLSLCGLEAENFFYFRSCYFYVLN